MTRLADIKAHESEVQDPEALAKYHELRNSVCCGTMPDLVMKLWRHSDDVAAAIQSWQENMEAQVLQQERDMSKDRMSQYEKTMADAAEERIHALDQLQHATCDQRATALAEVVRLDGKIRGLA